MVDTVRTIAQLLTIYANNTSGDITPQDLRDFVVTMESLAGTMPVSSSIQPGNSGTYYLNGEYDSPAADSNLTQASTTQAYGTANFPYAAHAFAVIGGTPARDGSLALVLTVEGTSITDAGVRNGSDSEVVVVDGMTTSTNDYFETSKKWIGAIVYRLSASGSTNFNLDFNYGFCAYENHGNQAFDLDHFRYEFLGGATDSGFDIELIHHKTTGWTYHASAFVPGAAALYKLSTDFVTEKNLASGKVGFWKRTGLSDSIDGSSNEGFLTRITVATNNSVASLVSNVYVKPTS